MKKELISELFGKFEDACYDLDGLECWSGRELMEIFNYSEWRAFAKLIERASRSCESSGEKISDHFVVYTKMVVLGSGAQREIEDVALTRYACYLIAQNGDPIKPEIAFAHMIGWGMGCTFGRIILKEPYSGQSKSKRLEQ
jgi:DNA-damage-inducible protein D